MVEKQFMQFDKQEGSRIKNDYNGKEVIDFKGKPLFAELAVLRLYQKKGWEGVWVDNYGKKFRINLPERRGSSVSLPPEVSKALDNIIEENGGLAGCWDLFLWRGKDIRFIELKRYKKDKLRLSQMNWLKSAVKIGIPINKFLIVEWNLKQ